VHPLGPDCSDQLVTVDVLGAAEDDEIDEVADAA
jgi:hypothetical protein